MQLAVVTDQPWDVAADVLVVPVSGPGGGEDPDPTEGNPPAGPAWDGTSMQIECPTAGNGLPTRNFQDFNAVGLTVVS